ncbi:hypothetical protein [Brevundimonas sp. M20]|uniref:hypothetical protein n=1 Tax=Brevundimonas sp. M20 TaxID=2591463 RepID=UPI0011470DB6|nr:hypothetical protein [Brevundimonas sp. M20]QDH72380.1 hypothetical protein FKQ52_02420 [Brevundimonas sp. M20]
MRKIKALAFVGAAVSLALPGVAMAQCLEPSGSVRDRSDFVVLGVVTEASTRGNFSDLELTYTVQVREVVKGAPSASFTFVTVERGAQRGAPVLDECGARPHPRLRPGQEAFFFMGGRPDDLHVLRIDRITALTTN